MATYLEITRDVAGLSGTVDRRTVTTVDATGRIGLIASLVREAWLEIQNEHQAWKFLIAEFPEAAVLGAGISAYNAAALNLPNWSEWMTGREPGAIAPTIWPAEPEMRAQESDLLYAEYPTFRASYQRGASVATAAATPRAFSIDNSDRYVVWPPPDRDYRLSGTFRRTAQELTADDDVPIILKEHHPVITWAGLLLLHRRDEAPADVLITTQQGLDTRKAALRRRYLRKAAISGAPVGGGRAGVALPSSPPSPPPS